MGVDGVGKPGPGMPPTGVGGSGSATSGADFSKTLEAGRSQGASATGASEELAKLQRGELTLDQYLDARVDAAVAHLGQLPAEQLAFVRQTLREQLQTDPVLVELVKRASQASSSQEV